MSKRYYARSLGPRQLATIFDRRDTLANDQDEVTFLVEIDPADPSACDVWDYGCGGDLGVFVVEADPEQLHDGPREDHGHSPTRSPAHVWADDASALGFDRAVFVRDPEEMGIVLGASARADALAQLTQHRGVGVGEIEAAAKRAAERTGQEFDTYRQLTQALIARGPGVYTEGLGKLGLEPWILETDPVHLAPSVRAAISTLARLLGVTA